MDLATDRSVKKAKVSEKVDSQVNGNVNTKEDDKAWPLYDEDKEDEAAVWALYRQEQAERAMRIQRSVPE